MPHQQKAQKNFAARWFEEVWNKSRREAIDEMFPEDAVLHDGRAEYRGPTEFKRFYDALRAQLSEARHSPRNLSKGDMVCMRWSSTAKQSSTGKHQHGLLQQLEGAAPNPSSKPPDNLQTQPPNAS